MTEAVEQLQSTLDRLLKDKDIVRVLEAGCGSATHINVSCDAHLKTLGFGTVSAKMTDYIMVLRNPDAALNNSYTFHYSQNQLRSVAWTKMT